MPDIRELKDQAAKYFSKGKFEKAAKAYEELCRLEPKDMQMRVRLGDALVKAGERPAAVNAYKVAAESYAKEGFLPRAIAVCKLILEVDPGHSETQSVLAQLYAKKSGGGKKPAPLPAPAAPAPARPPAAPAHAPAHGARPAIIPPPPPSVLSADAPLELDNERSFQAGVKTAEVEAEAAPATAASPADEGSGLELDTGDSKASWKGSTAAWEPQAPTGPPAAPAPAAQAQPPRPPAPPREVAAAPQPAPSPKPPPAPVATGEIDLGLMPPTESKPAPVAAPAQTRKPPAPPPPDEIDLGLAPPAESKPAPQVAPAAPPPAPEPAALEPELDLGLTSPAAPQPAMPAPVAPPPQPVAAPVPPAVAAPPQPVVAPVPPAPVVEEEPAPPPAPVPPAPVVEAKPPPSPALEPSLGDELMSLDSAEPEMPADIAPPGVSLKEMDVGEPALLGLTKPAAPRNAPATAPVPPPNVVVPPAVAKWTAPAPVAEASGGIADALAAALEAAGTIPSLPTAAQAPQAPAEAGGGWFAEPEGTREDPLKRRPTLAEIPTLAELGVASVNEDEEIEILTVTIDRPAEAVSLPEIPLFSDLSREAFIELTSQCDLRRCQPGEVIVKQGTVGTSFFVVTSGTVKVVRLSEKGEEIVLAKLTEGSFFGEMALLSGTPRGASVVAEDEAEALEISAALLSSMARRYPHVQQALKKFCRQRLLSNVLATSALFRPFDKAQRKELVEKFKAREVAAGEVILAEGQPADGLYVVMAGEVYVRKKRDGVDVKLASLKEGDVFGEISLLTKSAATATVAAARNSTILRLPRPTFDELISTHPQILMLVSELSDERLRAQQSFEQVSSDGLMLL